jgi:HEAT repeat protein
LLKDNDIQKRRAAVWALEKLLSRKAVKALRNALNDEDEEVRMWAKFALENITTK